MSNNCENKSRPQTRPASSIDFDCLPTERQAKIIGFALNHDSIRYREQPSGYCRPRGPYEGERTPPITRWERDDATEIATVSFLFLDHVIHACQKRFREQCVTIEQIKLEEPVRPERTHSKYGERHAGSECDECARWIDWCDLLKAWEDDMENLGEDCNFLPNFIARLESARTKISNERLSLAKGVQPVISEREGASQERIFMVIRAVLSYWTDQATNAANPLLSFPKTC